MFNKIKILLIAFIMLLSNVAFAATSAYSFFSESQFINKENKIDIVKQCRGIVNMPKVFCNICVELTEEIITFSNKDKKNSNINAEYNYNDIIGNIEAIENNNKKQKFIGFSSKEFKKFIVKDKNKFIYTARDRYVFYIIQYIGLLRANDLINSIILTKNIYFKPLLVV